MSTRICAAWSCPKHKHVGGMWRVWDAWDSTKVSAMCDVGRGTWGVGRGTWDVGRGMKDVGHGT
eukprot:1366471-Rhodomonas_salina.3